LSNPENNWIHFSVKAGDRPIVDARAEDVETLRALIDGALGVGAFEAAVRQYGFIHNDGDAVTAQAVQNLQQGGVAPVNPGLQANGPRPDFVPQGVPLEAPPQQGGGQPQYCVHGEKKWVPPGTSSRTGKPYNGFWACPAPKGQQCR
jgi:hypothetical protein